MERLWNGPFDDPRIKGIGDILWAKPEQGGLSYADTVVYQQLNTSYVPGPDGFPWATGRSRNSMSNLLAVVGISPVVNPLGPGSDSMNLDERLNSQDMVNFTNTGLRGLKLTDESRNIPTDKEIADAIIEAIEKNGKKDYTPFPPFETPKGPGSNWGGRGYYGGYGGYGGGAGGYYGPRVYFQEMRDFGDIRTPYANNTPFINSTNPIIRRADVRRERVWSERGRLNQWQ
jgi:hypothetical protein